MKLLNKNFLKVLKEEALTNKSQEQKLKYSKDL